MQTKLAIVLLCALTALPLAAQAARKPGLWEVTTTMSFVKGGPQIPPEQMEKMKQMGIKIPGMGSEPYVMKQCLTKEQAEKDDQAPLMKKDSACQVKDYRKSGGTFSATMVCDGPHMKGQGEMKGTYTSGVAYTGTSHFAGTSNDRGKPHELEIEQTFSGKWLGADCGSVKPFNY